MDYNKYTALILDLDGTLIETLNGGPFPSGVYDMQIKWDVFEGIGLLLPNVKDILIASNQGGIEEGYVVESSFRSKILYVGACLHDFLLKYNREVLVDARYCKKNRKCEMRKPETGMLTNSMMGLIQKDQILFIGDATDKNRDFSDSDKKCAENFEVDYVDVGDFIEDYKFKKLLRDV